VELDVSMMRTHEVEPTSAKRSGQLLPIGQNFLEKLSFRQKVWTRNSAA
jgi:hypothetical protein